MAAPDSPLTLTTTSAPNDTSLTTTHDTPDTIVHGLSYPPNFISSLPVLLPRPAPHEPIRALSAAQFSQIHLRNLLTHAPDSVLFPFLHGLEGDNEAQNSFFWSYGGHTKRTKVPKYRGLIWVACDDEDVDIPQSYQSSPIYSDEDLDDDDFSSSEIECDDEPEIEAFSMDVDTNGHSGKHSPDKGVGVHMHPVHHRTNSIPESVAPIYAVDYAYSATHDRRPSNASSFTASSIDSPASSSFSTSFTPNPSSSSLPKDDSLPSHVNGYSHNSPVTSAASSTFPSLLTSSFRASELLINGQSGPELVRPRVPDGISLRNFGIQVPIYATLSDVVIYSPKGATRTAFALAEKLKLAIEAKMNERLARLQAEGDEHPEKNLVAYNVFVLTATLPEMLESLPHLLSRVHDVRIIGGQTVPVSHSGAHTDGPDAHIRREEDDPGTVLKANTINFAQREKDEMRDLTKATEILSIPSLPDHLTASSPSTHWDPSAGQVYLGNVNDVPIADEWAPSNRSNFEDPFDYGSNDPAQGYGYDICIECHDLASFPSSAHIRAADEHLAILDATWSQRYTREEGQEIPIRPPPNANSVVHLPFPSSPPSTGASISALAPLIAFLDRWLRMPGAEPESPTPSARKRGMTFSPSSLPLPASFTGAFFSSAASASYTRVRSTSTSFSSYGYPPSYQPRSQAAVRTRPMKVLIYSSDGYTESSVLALSLLMAMRALSLPQAYLELQVAKKRSFFVYQADLGLLKRVEAKLGKDRGSPGMASHQYINGVESGNEIVWDSGRGVGNPTRVNSVPRSGDEIHSSSTQDLTLEHHQQTGRQYHNGFRRPRASTMPMMPAFTDHQLWFNDPRFNGSFPSRVLPFLYLGDLNHASNAYMLHALGITHVVSVGECALVPPPEYPSSSTTSVSNTTCNVGDHGSPKEHASLWIEEREGRIKVLDIQGVCDDGIDTLEPQLEPICNWIERARLEGGNVLVHCRVGVSRSATVTIAYVMKHLGLPLVDAYLIVRSRRLSVLIQPNMRLLYNLLGWEVKLAKERAGDNEGKLKAELARCLNWPYLAREVHALNEKYLH